MTEDALLDLWRGALTCAAEVAAPFLVVGLVIGLAIAILQTATQLQESSLTFVPKLGVALVVLALSGHWMLDKITSFTRVAFQTAAQPDQPTSTPEAAPDSPISTSPQP